MSLFHHRQSIRQMPSSLPARPRRSGGSRRAAAKMKERRRGRSAGRTALRPLLLLAMLLLAPAAPQAQKTAAEATLPHPIGSGSWYYQLGGSRPVLNIDINNAQRSLHKSELKRQVDICRFDIKKSIRSHFNHLQRNLYSLEQEIVDSAQALLKISGLSVLQRANPGMYDLVTRGIADGKEAFDTAVSSCQQVQRDLETGESTLDGWRRIARGLGWEKAREQTADPVEAERKIEEQAGEEGIHWVGGQQAGGAGQPPIRITGDVTAAGYRLWQPGGGPNPLAHIWDSPQTAAAWAISVLGESEIRLCRNCEPLKTAAGLGFHTEIQGGRAASLAAIQALLKNRGRPDAKQLATLASPGMGIAMSPAIIQALREEPSANRTILAERLATEIALTRALEKALLLRQLLRVGRREANIAANDAAQREVGRLLEHLDSEIENLLFEQRVRREALTNTALLLLERQRARRAQGTAALPEILPASAPPTLIEGGARRRTERN